MENRELKDQLRTLMGLLHRRHMQKHAKLGPMADTSRGQGRVIALLKMQNEISSKDIAYLLKIRQQSLNELLNKLEKNNYITRTPSSADKRVMLVSLTEKGKSEQPAEPERYNICECLNETEQKTFGEYLDRIILSLENQLDSENDEDDNVMKFKHFHNFCGAHDGKHHHHCAHKHHKHFNKKLECEVGEEVED